MALLNVHQRAHLLGFVRQLQVKFRNRDVHNALTLPRRPPDVCIGALAQVYEYTQLVLTRMRESSVAVPVARLAPSNSEQAVA
mgnify:CR=1 FL=1